MTLTEQWKKGELEQGWYYIECIDLPKRWIDIDYYRNDCYEDEGFCKGFFDHNDWRGIDKVLSPVPSYEEWRDLEDDLATCDKDLNNVCEQKEELYEENQQLKKENTQLRKFLDEFNALDVAKENQQLKELLKECREASLDYGNHSGNYELYDRIDNAIGEK